MPYLAPLFCFFLFLFSCYRISDDLHPQVKCTSSKSHLKQLSPSLPPLSAHEKQKPWGQEYAIGQKFAKDLDLYRAITTFKRAAYLMPEGERYRLLELEYQVMLCYYLGERYEEVITTYNQSRLYTVDTSFPTYHDLLVILYESYVKTDNELRAAHILRTLHLHYPETAGKLDLSTTMIKGSLPAIVHTSSSGLSDSTLREIVTHYDAEKKSVKKAQALNMVLPGAGYLYVGQKQSALTAFLLNGLFIATAIHFFTQGHLAAGIITTSFEAGWYFGGIYGGGESAKFYNERLYETLVYPKLNRDKLFPVLMLKYGF